MACGEKTRVWISPGDVVAAQKGKSSGESQARAAGDARTRVAGALASYAGASPERVGPCGSRPAESDLAGGHDEGVGGTGRGLGVPGVRDRLLHARDRGLESFASLPKRRSTRRDRASGSPTTSRRQPAGERDPDHG